MSKLEYAKGQRFARMEKSKRYRHSYMANHVRTGIAYQLRAIREKMGLSQAEFARKLCTTQSVISRIEDPEYGRVTLKTLLDIAIALDVALMVRFCNYEVFLDSIADLSPEALQIETFDETAAARRTRPSTFSFPIIRNGPVPPAEFQTIFDSRVQIPISDETKSHGLWSVEAA